MAPFRWPEARHELALAEEVAQHNPEKPDEWEAVARRLGKAFSLDSYTALIEKRSIQFALQNLKKIMSVLLTRGRLLIDSINILLTSEQTLQRK